MPALPRPSAALRTSQSLFRRHHLHDTTSPALVSRTKLSSQIPSRKATTTAVRAASTQSTHGAAEHTQHGGAEHAAAEDHSDHYDPPTGWLWGIKPGEEYKKEGWENVWYYGFYGSLIVTCIAYAFKPDTSIETWALEEAKRRLQADGTLPEDD